MEAVEKPEPECQEQLAGNEGLLFSGCRKPPTCGGSLPARPFWVSPGAICHLSRRSILGEASYPCNLQRNDR